MNYSYSYLMHCCYSNGCWGRRGWLDKWRYIIHHIPKVKLKVVY